jgi:hypothetical protein
MTCECCGARKASFQVFLINNNVLMLCGPCRNFVRVYLPEAHEGESLLRNKEERTIGFKKEEGEKP